MTSAAFYLADAILAIRLIELAADLLQLRALGRPQGDDPVFDASEYDRMRRYTGDGLRFGIVTALVSTGVFFAFWFGGGFVWLEGWAAGFGWGPILSGLAYFSLLWLGKTLLGLPFDLYDTFVIEERHGFNRTTAGVFWADFAKSLCMTAILGLPLAAMVLALFLHAGSLAWVWGWIVSGTFFLLLTYVSPMWILPLFYKFEPLPEGALRTAILGYADANRFPLADVSVIDGSRRSSKSNAFFTGIGRRKRVALYDTLVAAHPVPELVAVLAHEIGHYRRGHIPRRLVTGLLGLGGYLWLASLALAWPGLPGILGTAPGNVATGLVAFGFLLAPLNFFLGILSAWRSRRDEFEADRFAAETTGDGRSLAAALKKLCKSNLSPLHPHPLHVWLHHSHPPVLQRIAALDVRAAPGGSYCQFKYPDGRQTFPDS